MRVKNAVVAVLVVLCVAAPITAYLLVRGSGAGDESSTGPSPAASAEESGADVGEETPYQPPIEDPPSAMPADEAEQWRPAIEKFVAAYGAPQVGRQAWLQRLQPLVTKGLYQGFEQTDIRVVPRARMGRLAVIEKDTSGGAPRVRAAVELMPSRQQIALTAIWGANGWVVSEVAPAE